MGIIYTNSPDQKYQTLSYKTYDLGRSMFTPELEYYLFDQIYFSENVIKCHKPEVEVWSMEGG